MASIARRIVARIVRVFSNPQGKMALPARSATDILVEQGHLKVGADSDIKNMRADIRQPFQSRVYITIGEGCVINGSFVLETPEAKISVGSNTFIGGGSFISAKEIEIGDDVMFSWGCTVIDTNAHSLKISDRKNDVRDWKKGIDEKSIGKYKNWDKVISQKIVIQNKAWVGFDCIILKGVTIGEGSVIGAGSVVTTDVPPFSIYGGNPAKLIRMLTEEERKPE